ncbi:MAG: hypothetical protein ACKO4M_09565 [Betaproteobacteria bacterium]
MKFRLLAPLIVLLLCSHAIAKSDQCGEYTSVDLGEASVNMGKKTTFVHFRSSTQMHAAEGSKYNNLTGQCTGGALVFADQTLEAEGLCAVEDIDGDVLTYTFTQSRGQKEGRYARKGGTGKFAGSRETGWFRPIKLDGEITRGEWGGRSACE